jgi:hypothetical protein
MVKHSGSKAERKTQVVTTLYYAAVSSHSTHSGGVQKKSQLQAVFNTIACKHNNPSAAGIAKVIGL